jgi:hypothetical protein
VAAGLSEARTRRDVCASTFATAVQWIVEHHKPPAANSLATLGPRCWRKIYQDMAAKRGELVPRGTREILRAGRDCGSYGDRDRNTLSLS